MVYTNTVTLSVITTTRTSGFNSDGTMRGAEETPRTIEHVKRIINLPKDCLLERGKYKLVLSSDLDAGEPLQASSEWKQGFSELYTFFRDVMGDIERLISSEEGQDLWNALLAKRDKSLISKLGKELKP